MAQRKTKSKTKKTSKKKSSPRKAVKTKENIIVVVVRNMVRFLLDERFRFSLSIFILFFSAYLTLGFVSYLFTWKEDQSKLDISWYQLVTDAGIRVENWAGKTGALLANQFINQWFGIASFAFIFLLIIICFRLIRIRLLPLGRTLKFSLIGIIWTSITLGYFFGDSYIILGGSHGYYISHWLNSFIGKTGTFLFLFISLFAFIVFNFESAFLWIKNVVSKRFNVNIPYPNERFKDGYYKTPETATAEQPVSTSEKQTETETIDKNKEKATENEGEVTDKKAYLLNDKGEEENVTNLGFEVENTLENSDLALQNVEQSKQVLNQNLQGDKAEQLKLEVEKNKDILTNEVKEPEDDFDPTLELSNYRFPPLDLLLEHAKEDSEVTNEELITNKERIEQTLKDFKIDITKIKATIGPTITLYEIVPAPGVRISKIKNLEDDIALNLAALGIRIIAPMPGRGTIGIEVPNQNPKIVSMRSVIASRKYQDSKFQLPIALGKTISNESYVVDLVKMPHLLVAGATGQGKSVGLNAIIASLLYKKHPAFLKFVLIDPKKVELTLYDKIERHYLAMLPDAEEAIITDNQKVIHTLSSLNIEMDNRYNLLKKAQVRNIKEYNAKFIKRKLNPEKGHRFMPYIVVIIDEFADLIMTAGKEVELPLARIAQLARAVGIHLIVATQRPSTNIITGVIKANFPTRVAFKVASMIDSRTILDTPGANQLIGRGDMLITQGSDLIRLQCAFIDTPELEDITDFIGAQQGYTTPLLLPDYETGEDSNDPNAVDLSKRDDLFDEAARIVVANQQGSTSLIQRKLSIGYNRAGRIVDQLEAAGIVGPFEGSKARQVLYPDEYALEQYLNSLN